MKPALVALVALALACSCGNDTVGRIEISHDGETLVFRDTLHVLELRFTGASHGQVLTQFDFPAGAAPGRVAFIDEDHGVMIIGWITRLGAKRPKEIQRWFDEKINDLTLRGIKRTRDEPTRFGDHKARITEVLAPSKHHPDGAFARIIGVDVPEHDLDVVIMGVIDANTPSPEQRAWLDALLADVQAMRIEPGTKQ